MTTTRRSLLSLALILFIALVATVHALPTPQPPRQHSEHDNTPASPPADTIFRFDVSNPEMDTLWLVDSLPTVSWDTSAMPVGSTMDIALLHHEKKQSILLRRYVPTQVGSTLVNLRPEILPGTYSLLLTVFKGRSSTVLGRAMIQSLIVVEDEAIDPEQQETVDPMVQEPSTATLDLIEQDHEVSTPPSDNVVLTTPTHKTSEMSEFAFRRKVRAAVEDKEELHLTHQPTKGNLVLRAPYTVGWTIPKALEKARHARVQLLLVSNKSDEVVRVLATNVDAKAGFMYVFLPEDTPIQMYRIKVEIVGKGRKFSGYTHKFYTSQPAFSKRP
ncbi:hypothetical protein EMPS_10817 [Entomortierella parvispora]|uniref:Uncharacterized protein n=1 Tax=Entomortierella parvispora TaxID=205924 RepID=A0A9P3M1M6_9FUNG|nr:hypothetical protein EMPS_10817 [Entomortierella parvispora]